LSPFPFKDCHSVGLMPWKKGLLQLRAHCGHAKDAGLAYVHWKRSRSIITELLRRKNLSSYYSY